MQLKTITLYFFADHDLMHIPHYVMIYLLFKEFSILY